MFEQSIHIVSCYNGTSYRKQTRRKAVMGKMFCRITDPACHKVVCFGALSFVCASQKASKISRNIRLLLDAVSLCV